MNKKVGQQVGAVVTQYHWDGDQVIRELDGGIQT